MEFTGLGELKKRIENGLEINFKFNTDEQLVGIINEHDCIYRFDLDANGCVLFETGFDGIKRHFERDEKGQVIKVNRPSGIETRYAYDSMGRMTSVVHSSGEFEKLLYREDGKLLYVANEAGEVSFERDRLGRVILERQNGVEIRSEFDSLGMRSRITSSLGVDLTVSRDNMGNVLALKTHELFNPWEIRFKRDIFGLELERLFSNGVKSQCERDKQGRPIHHKVFGKDKKLERSRRYDWDINNQIKRYIDFGQEITQFKYDDLGQLSVTYKPDGQVEYRAPDAIGNLFFSNDRKERKYGLAGQILEDKGIKFLYDLEGNLIEKTLADGKIWQYEWYATGMLRAVVRPDGERITFKYDALGRRISKTFKSLTKIWIWDGNIPLHEWELLAKTQILTSFESHQNQSAENEQDEEIIIIDVKSAKQLQKNESNDIVILESREYQSNEMVSEVPNNYEFSLPDSEHLVTWLFEPESFTPIAKLVGDRQYSIQTDYLGVPISMYDNLGNKVWAGSLNSYGTLSLNKGESNFCPFRYPGQYEDEETGLFYNRFRYYDSNIGKYISQDPIGLFGGRNLYNYSKDTNCLVDVLGLNTGIGNIGETSVKDTLVNSGNYSDVVSIQNNSGHGVDILAKNAQTGEWEAFEVKTTSTSKAPGLSADQRLGADFYTQDRLGRAASGSGPYSTLSAADRARAQQILAEVQGQGGIKTAHKYEVFIDANGNVTKVNSRPWKC